MVVRLLLTARAFFLFPSPIRKKYWGKILAGLGNCAGSAWLNRGLGEHSDNAVCRPGRVCDDAAPLCDSYVRGRSKQEAAGSQHHDVGFGGQPMQNAGYDHMHPDVDKYGNMATNEGFYDQPRRGQVQQPGAGYQRRFLRSRRPGRRQVGSLATVINEGFYDQDHPDADK